MARWWGKRDTGAGGRAPDAGGSRGRGTREPAIDRLSVDGVVVPLRERYEEFEDDVRARRLALLRADFRLFSELSPAYPLFRIAESVGDVSSSSTLCCLRCHARHSVSALQTGMALGRPPLTGCQRCGCPDAVLIHDPGAGGPDQQYDIRRVTGAGRRVERVTLWSRGAALPPEAVQQALDLLDQGEDFSGAALSGRVVPDGHADVEGLAAAVAAAEQEEGILSSGAYERQRALWLRVPPHGDVYAVVVLAAD